VFALRRTLLIIFIAFIIIISAVIVLIVLRPSSIKYKTVVMKEGNRGARGILGIPTTGNPPYPAVIIVHGGAGGNWKATEYVAKVDEVKRIIEMGFVILSVDYGPRGTLFKGVVGNIELAGDDITDTLIAYRYLLTLDFVDKNRIFTLGGSHGGYISLMMGVFADVNLAGVIEFYAPTNLTAGAIYLNCTITDENRTALKKWSPITWVKNYTAPLLIIHGSNDELIPIEQAYEFITALKKKEKHITFMSTPKGMDSCSTSHLNIRLKLGKRFMIS